MKGMRGRRHGSFVLACRARLLEDSVLLVSPGQRNARL
jgi:hypothetical protein